jgi:hypothetical protein
VLYREREGDKPHGYVELTILTQAGDDEDMYAGTYKISVFDGTDPLLPEGKSWDFDGAISCGAE